jgi:outer membrane lipoprotein SlyB
MRKVLAVVSFAALIAAPHLTLAQEGAAGGAAAGAVTGGVVGGVVGGPVGAAVGAGVGAAAGGAAGGAADSSGTVVVQPGQPATTSTRTCITDAAGNQTCREVVR